MRNLVIVSMTMAIVWFAWLIPHANADDIMYKIADKDGNITYTNIPTANAEPIDTPAISIIPARLLTADSTARDRPDASGNIYNLHILQPANEQTFRVPAEPVYVDLDIQPPLNVAAGHRLQVLLDGELERETRQTRIRLSDLNRGSHTLLARIVDRDDRILQSSDSVLFFAHQPSILLDAENN